MSLRRLHYIVVYICIMTSVYQFSNDLFFHVYWARILIFFYITTQIGFHPTAWPTAFHHLVTLIYYKLYYCVHYIILLDDYADCVYDMRYTYIVYVSMVAVLCNAYILCIYENSRYVLVVRTCSKRACVFFAAVTIFFIVCLSK